MDFLKKGLSKVKETMSQVDLLAKLAEATTNDSSFQTISLLNEISSRSDNPEETENVEKNPKRFGLNRTYNKNRKSRFYR